MEEIKFKIIEPVPFVEGNFPEVDSDGEISGMVRHRLMTLQEFKEEFPKD